MLTTTSALASAMRDLLREVLAQVMKDCLAASFVLLAALTVETLLVDARAGRGTAVELTVRCAMAGVATTVAGVLGLPDAPTVVQAPVPADWAWAWTGVGPDGAAVALLAICAYLLPAGRVGLVYAAV